MLTESDKNILVPLAHFDLAGYPVSFLEWRKWLPRSATVAPSSMILELSKLNTEFDRRAGLYFLSGRENLIDQRRERYILAQDKFKKARRIVRLLSFFPWLRGIAVYSSLSFANSNLNSDIDLFLVTAASRVWSTRFFVNLFLKIFSLRPNAQTGRDKICVSFLADENHLDLSLVLNSPDDWPYIYGTGQFIFIYNERGQAEKFFQANNWLRAKLPDWYPYQANWRRRLSPRFLWLKFMLEIILALVPENIYRQIQFWIMPEKLKTMSGYGTSVVFNDYLIKLHDNDHRGEWRPLFDNKLKEILDHGNHSN